MPDLALRISTSQKVPERIVRELRGASMWVSSGPESVRVKLAGSDVGDGVTSLLVERIDANGYAAVFDAENCGKYELHFTRLLDGWQREWKGASAELMAGECTRDSECGSGQLCVFSWLVWSDVRRHWLGSGGRCQEGIRRTSDSDCPEDHRCDAHERIQAAAHRALQAPRCKD